jgi:hypothetical protein
MDQFPSPHLERNRVVRRNCPPFIYDHRIDFSFEIKTLARVNPPFAKIENVNRVLAPALQ